MAQVATAPDYVTWGAPGDGGTYADGDLLLVYPCIQNSNVVAHIRSPPPPSTATPTLERVIENGGYLTSNIDIDVSDFGEKLVIARIAFRNATGLKSIVGLPNVSSIGDYAFSDCTGLRSIYISPGTTIDRNAFFNCPALIAEIDTTADIPSGLSASGITSIKISRNSTTIVEDAFRNCTNLTSVFIPSNVTTIGTRAFAGCTGLRTILIPSTVTSIAPNVFDGCTNLASIVCLCPYSVMTNVILPALTNLYYDPNTPGWVGNTFTDISTLPSGSLQNLLQSYLYAIGPIKYATVFIASGKLPIDITALATPALITPYAIICAVKSTTNSADFYRLIPNGITSLSASQSRDVTSVLKEGITGELTSSIDVVKPVSFSIDKPSNTNSSFFAIDSTQSSTYTFVGSNDTLTVNNGSHTFNTQLLKVGDVFTIQYIDGTTCILQVNKFGSILASPYRIGSIFGSPPAPAPAPAPPPAPAPTPDPAHDPLHCYVKGSEILTQRGYVAIEDLNVGDLVVTKGKFETRPKPAIGLWTPPPSAKLESIIWKGHVTLSLKTDEHRPIRIKQNALGVNIPSKDLCISPNHSIMHNGRVILARDLLNDTSIVRDYCDEATYYHIKLKTHSIVIANGLTSESYKEDDTRDVSKFFEDSSKIRRSRFRIPFLGKH
jgi:hypothetical protein